MIAIRKMTIEDLDIIIRLCEERKIKLDIELMKEWFLNAFALKQGDSIIGFGFYSEEGNNGVMEQAEIFTRDDQGDYLDMLIRSILNAAERQNLDEMIVNDDKNAELFLQIGFITMENDMRLDLKNFFSMKCSCSHS